MTLAQDLLNLLEGKSIWLSSSIRKAPFPEQVGEYILDDLKWHKVLYTNANISYTADRSSEEIMTINKTANFKKAPKNMYSGTLDIGTYKGSPIVMFVSGGGDSLYIREDSPEIKWEGMGFAITNDMHMETIKSILLQNGFTSIEQNKMLVDGNEGSTTIAAYPAPYEDDQIAKEILFRTIKGAYVDQDITLEDVDGNLKIVLLTKV